MATIGPIPYSNYPPITEGQQRESTVGTVYRVFKEDFTTSPPRTFFGKRQLTNTHTHLEWTRTRTRYLPPLWLPTPHHAYVSSQTKEAATKEVQRITTQKVTTIGRTHEVDMQQTWKDSRVRRATKTFVNSTYLPLSNRWKSLTGHEGFGYKLVV